jgi:hypothetical protein
MLLLLLPAGDTEKCSYVGMEAVKSPSCRTCVRQVAIEGYHTCVLMSGGDVQLECMGSNKYGELGLGVSDSNDHQVLKPATALAGIPISSIAVGYHTTCVLAAPSRGNQVYCFGDGSFGPLGNGKNNSSAVPVAVQGLRQSPRIIQLSYSNWRFCVLYAAPAAGTKSAVQCWGGYDNQATDVVAFDTAGVTYFALETMGDPCMLSANKTVSCGSMFSGSVTGAVRLSVGGVINPIACDIVRSDVSGVVMCWGAGDWDSALLSNSTAPWRVAGLPGNVVDVVVGMRHACALVSNGGSSGGEVYCWGANYDGVLGQGPACNEKGSRTPLRVKGISNVVALYGGKMTTCAVTAEQIVLCWGDKNGAVNADWVEGRTGLSVPTVIKQTCT